MDLTATCRALAGPMVDALQNYATLESDEIQVALVNAGIIAIEIYDSANPAHEGIYDLDGAEPSEGEQIWRMTDFGNTLLGGER